MPCAQAPCGSFIAPQSVLTWPKALVRLHKVPQNNSVDWPSGLRHSASRLSSVPPRRLDVGSAHFRQRPEIHTDQSACYSQRQCSPREYHIQSARCRRSGKASLRGRRNGPSAFFPGYSGRIQDHVSTCNRSQLLGQSSEVGRLEEAWHLRYRSLWPLPHRTNGKFNWLGQLLRLY